MSAVHYLEDKVIESLIEELIQHCFFITVNDGENDVLVKSDDVQQIIKAMKSTDEDTLYVYRTAESPGSVGFVYLVYGEMGHDVINDYTVSLEPYMKNTLELTSAMEDGKHERPPYESK